MTKHRPPSATAPARTTPSRKPMIPKATGFLPIFVRFRQSPCLSKQLLMQNAKPRKRTQLATKRNIVTGWRSLAKGELTPKEIPKMAIPRYALESVSLSMVQYGAIRLLIPPKVLPDRVTGVQPDNTLGLTGSTPYRRPLCSYRILAHLASRERVEVSPQSERPSLAQGESCSVYSAQPLCNTYL